MLPDPEIDLDFSFLLGCILLNVRYGISGIPMKGKKWQTHFDGQSQDVPILYPNWNESSTILNHHYTVEDTIYT